MRKFEHSFCKLFLAVIVYFQTLNFFPILMSHLKLSVIRCQCIRWMWLLERVCQSSRGVLDQGSKSMPQFANTKIGLRCGNVAHLIVLPPYPNLLLPQSKFRISVIVCFCSASRQEVFLFLLPKICLWKHSRSR